MAIAVTLEGTHTNKGTQFSVYVNIAVVAGDWFVVCFASDTVVNMATTRTYLLLNDTRYALTKDAEAINAGGVVVSILSIKAVETDGSTSLFVGNDNLEAKAVSVYKVTGLADNPLDKTSTGTGLGTEPTSGATAALAQADELVIGAIGAEEQTDEKGTWTTGASYVSGNDQDAGTTGGGGASNVSIFGVAEIVSATTAQEAEQTSTLGFNWAAAIATYKASVAGYYHGLKVQGVGELALCDVGTHPLRIRKGGTTYGIELVATDDPNASSIRIKTPDGIKAIRKYT